MYQTEGALAEDYHQYALPQEELNEHVDHQYSHQHPQGELNEHYEYAYQHQVYQHQVYQHSAPAGPYRAETQATLATLPVQTFILNAPPLKDTPSYNVNNEENPRSRSRVFWLYIGGAVALVVIALVLTLVFTLKKNPSPASQSSLTASEEATCVTGSYPFNLTRTEKTGNLTADPAIYDFSPVAQANKDSFEFPDDQVVYVNLIKNGNNPAIGASLVTTRSLFWGQYRVNVQVPTEPGVRVFVRAQELGMPAPIFDRNAPIYKLDTKPNMILMEIENRILLVPGMIRADLESKSQVELMIARSRYSVSFYLDQVLKTTLSLQASSQTEMPLRIELGVEDAGGIDWGGSTVISTRFSDFNIICNKNKA